MIGASRAGQGKTLIGPPAERHTEEANIHANVSDIFKAIGPAASIIFAAWIFVGFLQVRYDASVERYLDMLKQYRSDETTDAKRTSLKDEILICKRRCALMNVASTIGLVSAIILVMALIVGVFALVYAGIAILTFSAISLAVLGLVLVVTATIVVILEGILINGQLERALRDIPDLVEGGTAEKSMMPNRKKLGLVK